MSPVKRSVTRRTYFAHALIDDTLDFLPKALELTDVHSFRNHIVEQLHYNSLNCRKRYANYIIHRFSHDGKMDLRLARALTRFGKSPAAMEILYFEMLQVEPTLLEWATLWMAEMPREGAGRETFFEFIAPRLAGRAPKSLVDQGIRTFKQFGKIRPLKPGFYQPVWAEPPLEAFLYVFARVLPDRTMMQISHFTALPIFRALLWPAQNVAQLIREAEHEGHVSKISHLDQYHQFTTSSTGEERLEQLLNG